MSYESIKISLAPNNVLDPSLDYLGTKLRVKFNGICLKEDEITLNYGKTVNIYIAYEINKNVPITLENCWFGAVSLIKNILE